MAEPGWGGVSDRHGGGGSEDERTSVKSQLQPSGLRRPIPASDPGARLTTCTEGAGVAAGGRAPADHPHPNRGGGVSSTGPCWTRCSPSSLPGVERVSPGPGPTSAGSARDTEPGGSQASAGTVARPSARPRLPLSLGLDHSESRPKQESVLTALMLAVDVGPRTRDGQAASAPGGSGHAGGVSLEKGRKVRCGGPRDAGRARRKPWSQQTLVSPRLWPEGNQMLPVPRPSSRSPICPPASIGPSAPRPCPSSQSSVHPPGPPSVLPVSVSPSQPSRWKLWSQQTLVSPRLWPKGNQMLPVLRLSLPAAPPLSVPHSESLPLPCGSCGDEPPVAHPTTTHTSGT